MKRILKSLQKALLVGILFLLTAFQMKAQEVDYSTYYHKGVKWRIGEFMFGVIFQRVSLYEIKEDSVISERCYNKLYCDNHLIALIRNEGGNIYFRQIVNEPPPISLWRELRTPTSRASLHTDYLLCSYVNEWKDGTPIVYSSWKNGMKELVKDTIRESSLEIVQLDNGRSCKKYKEIIYGFGDYRKGPLGTLMYEDNGEAGGMFRDEEQYRLVDLYDNDELVFRSTQYVINDHNAIIGDTDIHLFYSSVDKTLLLQSSLPENSYTVELFRMDGVKVLSFSGMDCSLAGISPGVYTVQVLTGNACIYKDKIRVE